MSFNAAMARVFQKDSTATETIIVGIIQMNSRARQKACRFTLIEIVYK